MQHVCALADVPVDEGLRITSLTPPIAVFRSEDGEVFALDDTCSHQDASLASGWVEDCWVECPLHGSRFDLRTGAVDNPPATRGVRAHAVEVRGDEVWVELSDATPQLPPGVSHGVGR